MKNEFDMNFKTHTLTIAKYGDPEDIKNNIFRRFTIAAVDLVTDTLVDVGEIWKDNIHPEDCEELYYEFTDRFPNAYFFEFVEPLQECTCCHGGYDVCWMKREDLERNGIKFSLFENSEIQNSKEIVPENMILVEDIDTSVLTKTQKRIFDEAFKVAMNPLQGEGIESHVAFSHGGKYMKIDKLAMGWKTCAIREFLENHPEAEPSEQEMKRLMSILARAEVLLGIVSILGGK